MTTSLLIAQWSISFVAVGFYTLLVREVAREYGWWAIAFVVFPPALLFVYVPTRWRRCRWPLLGFLAGFAVAVALQRVRLGYWAWPDVERYR